MTIRFYVKGLNAMSDKKIIERYFNTFPHGTGKLVINGKDYGVVDSNKFHSILNIK